MMGAMCGSVKQCITELWKVCEQQPACIHDIWQLRRQQGEISELQVPSHLAIIVHWTFYAISTPYLGSRQPDPLQSRRGIVTSLYKPAIMDLEGVLIGRTICPWPAESLLVSHSAGQDCTRTAPSEGVLLHHCINVLSAVRSCVLEGGQVAMEPRMHPFISRPVHVPIVTS